MTYLNLSANSCTKSLIFWFWHFWLFSAIWSAKSLVNSLKFLEQELETFFNFLRALVDLIVLSFLRFHVFDPLYFRPIFCQEFYSMWLHKIRFSLVESKKSFAPLKLFYNFQSASNFIFPFIVTEACKKQFQAHLRKIIKKVQI